MSNQIATFIRRETTKNKNDSELPQSIPDKGYTSDPITKESYEYTIVNGSEYELCARFETDSQNNRKKDDFYRRLDPFWYHSQGRYCYKLNAKEDVPNLVDYSRY